jgi:hypothetical protein
MNLKQVTELLEKCESLEETLKMAHDEAIGIQKQTRTENLDVMHISQAQEIVAMRIGYLNRQKENLEAEVDAKAKAEGSAPQQQQQQPPPTV